MTQAERVEIAGEPLCCFVCGHWEFKRQKVLLKTGDAIFLRSFSSLFEQAAQALICGRCGYVHWFVPAPEGLKDEFHCPSCGETVREGQEECASCGWTYKTPVGR